MDCGKKNIGCEEKLTVQTNKQTERYLNFRKYYIDKAQNIANTIAVLDYLTTHDGDFRNLFTIAPKFLSAVITNFWASAITDLYGFFYNGNDLSFKKFFNYIIGNWNNILTDRVKEYVYREQYNTVFEVIETCKKIITDNEEKINLLKIFRDKVFAHFGDPSKMEHEIQISIDFLKEMFKITENIINKIEVLYCRTTHWFDFNMDIHQICYAVTKFFEYRNDIHILDLQKKQNGNR